MKPKIIEVEEKPKHVNTSLPHRGRPLLDVVRCSITLTQEDVTFFKGIGFGSISAGIRRAGAKVRGHILD